MELNLENVPYILNVDKSFKRPINWDQTTPIFNEVGENILGSIQSSEIHDLMKAKHHFLVCSF